MKEDYERLRTWISWTPSAFHKRPFAKGTIVLIGNARVSKGDDQSNKAEAKALADAGCKRIFKEEASGGRWERPDYTGCLII